MDAPAVNQSIKTHLSVGYSAIRHNESEARVLHVQSFLRFAVSCLEQ